MKGLNPFATMKDKLTKKRRHENPVIAHCFSEVDCSEIKFVLKARSDGTKPKRQIQAAKSK